MIMKKTALCAAILVTFLMAGCSTVQPYINKARVSIYTAGDAIQRGLDKYDIKITPYEEWNRPEDDTN